MKINKIEVISNEFLIKESKFFFLNLNISRYQSQIIFYMKFKHSLKTDPECSGEKRAKFRLTFASRPQDLIPVSR